MLRNLPCPTVLFRLAAVIDPLLKQLVQAGGGQAADGAAQDELRSEYKSITQYGDVFI